MLALIGGLLGAAWDIFGGAAEVVTEAATGLGEFTLTTVGDVGSDVLGFAGETIGGGLDILGGLPEAATETIDYLGNQSYSAVQALQIYRSLAGVEPTSQAGQVRGAQLPALQPRLTVAPVGPGLAVTPGQAFLPTLPNVVPAYGVTLPEWARTAQAQAAQPDYLMYAAIAAIGILLLRK